MNTHTDLVDGDVFRYHISHLGGTMAFTKENAGYLAEQAAKARAAKRDRLENPPSARETFEEAAGRLALELVDAALGKGSFRELPPDKRLAAVIKCLEFGVGRPGQSKPDKADNVPTPESLFS